MTWAIGGRIRSSTETSAPRLLVICPGGRNPSTLLTLTHLRTSMTIALIVHFVGFEHVQLSMHVNILWGMGMDEIIRRRPQSMSLTPVTCCPALVILPSSPAFRHSFETPLKAVWQNTTEGSLVSPLLSRR